MRFFASIKVLRVALSLTVAFWMAGAGCMLGCGNMTAMAASDHAPSTDATVVVANDSCAAMHGHDCCAKRAAKKAPAKEASEFLSPIAAALESDGFSPAAMDCPLAVNASAALAKVQQQDDPDAVVTSETHREIFASLSEQSRALATPLRLPNRGHTYLRCCVFLI
jgi:hypothetical protein